MSEHNLGCEQEEWHKTMDSTEMPLCTCTPATTSEHRKYKSNEWHPQCDYADVDYDYSAMVYVDSNGKPITGLLEDYWYFGMGDSRNWQLVVDGKRVTEKKNER